MSDTQLTFAIFIYQEIVFANDSVAGFNAGDGVRFYNIPVLAPNLDVTSNVNRPGEWLFRIDSENIILPNTSTLITVR